MNKRIERKEFKVEGSITVSKGVVSFPTLTVALVGGRKLVIQHNKGRYPMSSQIKDEHNYGSCDHWSWYEVNDTIYNSILSAINSWEGIKNPKLSHLNPHTFLYTWCLCKDDVNLYEEGVLT